MYLRLLVSSDWRRTKLFDIPQSTRACSNMPFATSSFVLMSGTSLPDAVTHNYCVLGAILVKRSTNSLDVAGSVECSHLLTLTVFWSSITVLRFRNSVRPTPRTLLRRLTVTVSCGTWYRVRGTAFVCIMP